MATKAMTPQKIASNQSLAPNRPPKKIELLAPAKDLNSGIEAILHGADAVYIGAPKFSARAAASNSLQDIEALVNFAHPYRAKVYVALNTILHDEELPEAEKMIHQLQQIGVDALIVQDMGICQLDLPPIPLHASTQTDNRSVEKVRFLEEAGFSQVVLARELSLEEIRQIADQSAVRLEVFVHGALCVSYSGQCYISQVLASRSANRGVCAQYCRLPYTLIDSKGRVLIKDKHLLSLKDLNRTEQLEALIDAGVSSFKIEGRLKDSSYCKNVTAWYRQKLDAIISRRDDLQAASSPYCRYSFEPDVNKSFNRGFTPYFLTGKREIFIQPGTPKSLGEALGMAEPQNKTMSYKGELALHNGDGLSFFNEKGEFDGFRLNKIEGKRLIPAGRTSLPDKAVFLYRTHNQVFEQELAKPSATRYIPVQLSCRALAFGFVLEMKDREGNNASIAFESEKIPAKKSQREILLKTLSKNTCPPYEVSSCELEGVDGYFVPLSLWTAQRNLLYERFDMVRRLSYRREEKVFKPGFHPYPQETLSYLGNVLNRKAFEFYKQHGVQVVSPALESKNSGNSTTSKGEEIVLMRCKHCLKHYLGACPKESSSVALEEPLYLLDQGEKLRLKFDCKACEMLVLK